MTQAAANEAAESAGGPFPPEFYDDPYPLYAQMRQISPVMFIEPLNASILTGYDVVYNAALDERFGVNYEEYQTNRMGASVVNEPFFQSARHSMVCNDPPDHTRMRRQHHFRSRHRCIGAVLVATNLQIMLRVFLQRARDFNVVQPEVGRHMSMATRGFDAYPVTGPESGWHQVELRLTTARTNNVRS